MNLWLVGNQYVISDGPAGAVYLANAFDGETVKLIRRNVTTEFKPQLITVNKANQLLGRQ